MSLTRTEFVALFAVIALLVFIGFYDAGQNATTWILALNMPDLD